MSETHASRLIGFVFVTALAIAVWPISSALAFSDQQCWRLPQIQAEQERLKMMLSELDEQYARTEQEEIKAALLIQKLQLDAEVTTIVRQIYELSARGCNGSEERDVQRRKPEVNESRATLNRLQK